MSSGTPRTLRIFVCTRNRPDELERCLSSLAHSFSVAFPGQQASCYVFDDSTVQIFSLQTALLCHRKHFLNLHLHYVRTEEDLAIFHSHSSSSLIHFSPLRPSCKRLGSSAWDLAGVRNLAFLCALSCSEDDDLLLFLDDDICFESAFYHGHWIAIDGAQVLHQLSEQIPSQTIGAAGVGYYGRHDTSVRQHLSFIVEEMRQWLHARAGTSELTPQFQRTLSDISRFPHALPLHLTLPDSPLSEGGPGISGAVLATTPVSLRSHGLPRWYNEDWTWLALLGTGPGNIHKIEARVLHAAPSQAPLTLDFLCYQLQGDILYAALENAVQHLPPHLQRLPSCQTSLSPHHVTTAIQDNSRWLAADLARTQEVQRLLQSLKNTGLDQRIPLDALFDGIHLLISYLEDAFQFVTLQDPLHLWEMLQSYFDFIALWRTTVQ